ncbi:hypothetical protein BCAMP_12120 [Brochothrix campestris FSL F6-1037]|uniref:Uncharacterized protein n=1 Tax=Brochothrix campestris FSL F6-1037 TaxID=1265861 RepID=W7CC03_9LIST|nr:hypothetical protein BCAMP_12120 [Brochothrix campestris FSL F6-1037]
MPSDDIAIECFIPKRPAFIWARMSVNLTLKFKMIVKTKHKKKPTALLLAQIVDKVELNWFYFER